MRSNANDLTIAVSRLEFLSCREKMILAENLDNISDLALLSIEDISVIIGRSLKTKMWRREAVNALVLRDASLLRAYDISVVPFGSEEYPPLLAEIHDPPFALFCRGDLRVLKKNCCAVVGTRKPCLDSMKAAFEFSKEAAENAYTVVSGLAMGIDACAHKGALSAVSAGAHGSTAAVLACGADWIYPAANKKLAAALLQSGGCIVSEYAPGESPKKWRFPARNRIISGLSQMTLIAEAPPKSGALITADFALEQNRELLFHASALEKHRQPQDENPPPGCADWYVSDGAPVVSSFAEAVCAAGISLPRE
ncbi:MAG: DNA-processing protein DprA [Bacteroides sp.]|nr:DNA-processing protein DprA [Prevotella sp.]MCM1407435.1 DNA-processing protein DprA [Treponema brennaborense]MCM1469925.1 DNA-processing protein DprA [Bacteroides sp.]